MCISKNLYFFLFRLLCSARRVAILSKCATAWVSFITSDITSSAPCGKSKPCIYCDTAPCGNGASGANCFISPFITASWKGVADNIACKKSSECGLLFVVFNFRESFLVPFLAILRRCFIFPILQSCYATNAITSPFPCKNKRYCALLSGVRSLSA